MKPHARPSPPVIPAARAFKKTVLSLQQRVLIITQVQDKVPLDVLAANYSISERGVRVILSRREQVWRLASEGMPHSFRAATVSAFPLSSAVTPASVF